MQSARESLLLAAAQAGDTVAFERLVAPYRRELLVHGYRLLGSLADAEDMLQETLLRAWTRRSTFAGRGTWRAWLYKIMTNAALDFLKSRQRRLLPIHTHLPSAVGDPFPDPVPAAYWLEPLPDKLIDERAVSNPAARYEALESVTLAFLAALQHLPGRQRAALILRDVLDWSTDEVADILGTSSTAIHSILQRARTTLQSLPKGVQTAASYPYSAATATLLARYVQAWEAADVAQLVALLREDAIMNMPPLPLWLQGRDAIRTFLETHLFGAPNHRGFHLQATRANGCPAYFVWPADSPGVGHPLALHILSLRDGAIIAIDDYLHPDEKIMRYF